MVDRSLDAGCRGGLDRNSRARDVGGEERLQSACNAVRQMLAALRCVRVGAALAELVLPLSAGQEIAAGEVSDF